DRSIVTAGGRTPAIAADRDALDDVRVPREDADDLAGGEVPQRDSPIPAGTGKVRAVGTERDVHDFIALRQGTGLLVSGRVPDADHRVAARGGQVRAVGAEREIPDPTVVPLDGAPQVTRGGIPEVHLLTRLASRGEGLAVGAEGQGQDQVQLVVVP